MLCMSTMLTYLYTILNKINFNSVDIDSIEYITLSCFVSTVLIYIELNRDNIEYITTFNALYQQC